MTLEFIDNLKEMNAHQITSFKFEIGSYFGRKERIEYLRGKVTYTFSRYTLDLDNTQKNVIERIVDAKQLEPLNAMLPVISGWDEYSNDEHGICDGVSWSLHIRCGRQHLIRAGQDSFPVGFEKMEAILENLSGKKLYGQ